MTGQLTAKERRLLESESWSISGISLWEIATLVQLGRIEVDLDGPELSRLLSRVHRWPITLDICRAMRDLDVRGDPADEIIAATSVVHRVPLLTRDQQLKRSRRIPLAR